VIRCKTYKWDPRRSVRIVESTEELVEHTLRGQSRASQRRLASLSKMFASGSGLREGEETDRSTFQRHRRLQESPSRVWYAKGFMAHLTMPCKCRSSNDEASIAYLLTSHRTIAQTYDAIERLYLRKRLEH
jgi:hypothetical protein